MSFTLDKAIPILDTRKVLFEHLSAKISPLFSSKSRANEAAEEIAETLQNNEIISLLEDEKKLLTAVGQTKGYSDEKEELGEELYTKVLEFEADLCPKITGMLLELNNSTLRELIDCEDSLLKAVEKSKKEFLSFAEEAASKEELGEALYDLVRARYPTEVAAHLTGMLLELKLDDLKKLMTDSEELEKKLNLAYAAFENYRTH
ncbi:Hypothetical protein NTJ_10949 [Nesidiocoris tenuis]|nr:Hypothetical protein NTJ_10949 [Nesidiocoris tenuis]